MLGFFIVFNATFNNISVISWRLIYFTLKYIYQVFICKSLTAESSPFVSFYLDSSEACGPSEVFVITLRPSSSVIFCWLTFQSFTWKPLDKMNKKCYIDSPQCFVFTVLSWNSSWLLRPTMLSNGRKFQICPSNKPCKGWDCCIIMLNVMFLPWPGTKFVFYLSIDKPIWSPS